VSEARQRIRARFRKGERVRHISHLDVLRYWERAIRRAGLPLCYSQGFTPHPRIAFAAPLPLGFIGEGEIMEVLLEERVSLDRFAAALNEQTTPDLDLCEVTEVALGLPALPTLLRWADYRLALEGVTPEHAVESVNAFLATETFPWRQEREGKKAREYDLRTGVASVAVEDMDGAAAIAARVSCGQELTVRPEQLVAALFPTATVERYVRERLLLEEPSAALKAWRKKGQYE
jgi:radical SAM-linked protein